MANQSLQKASLLVANVSSISNTIQGNPNSISSLSSTNSQSFTNNLTNTTTSAVGDPIAAVLTKTLSRIATTTVSAQKKVDDLTTQLESYISKNSLVQVINNKIVITVTQQDHQMAIVEKSRIEAQISSIRNVLNVLKTTINTLQAIVSTVSVIQKLLTVQEALLTISPVSKATYSVLKQGIKIIFLRDMLKTYSTVIGSQLSQSSQTLNQLVAKFMNLQVSINVQNNANQGLQTTPDQALLNISQELLNTNTTGSNLDNQSNTFVGGNGRTYILKVIPYGIGQLIGQAIDQLTGQLAVATAPSYTENPDELMGELKSILNN